MALAMLLYLTASLAVAVSTRVVFRPRHGV
jgi:hypothetical protein